MSLAVAPLVGAWIEMLLASAFSINTVSLLSWERGLKFVWSICHYMILVVAPLVGAWIEIRVKTQAIKQVKTVAPLVGAWIEIGTKI